MAVSAGSAVNLALPAAHDLQVKMTTWRYSRADMPLPERALIAEIRRMAGVSKRRPADRSGRPTGSAIVAGIGDDCAVLRVSPGSDLLVTTDFSLEGIHFRRDWHPAESVGHRCLARGLSDIAAMGGKPVAFFLSLAVPRELPQAWVRGFTRGLINLARKHGATLAGGDTAESPNGILADVIVVGAAPKGKAVSRSRARPGDQIYVSGELGGSAAAVLQLQAHPKKKLNPRDYRRHFYPEPRIALGRLLREKELASAMIDTSDGLSTDLAHICQESGVGAEVDAAEIPRARVGNPPSAVDLELALHGGEDYELLFTVPAGKRVPAQIAGAALTHIGEITRAKKMLIRDGDGIVRKLSSRGWEHFRK
ncbi:MAG: thiamine-phosphate kinase [Candidatus Sulfotelmatobacter sp.]